MQPSAAPHTPLEPARTVRVTIQLTEWTTAALAQGIILTEADPLLPAGSTLAVLGGIPGETVAVDVTFPAIWREKQRKRRKPPLVRLAHVLAAAPERITAPCPVFGDCGGCRLQHLPYPAQLAWKHDRVVTEICAVGLDAALVAPAQGMAEPWNFRNQMRFAVNREGTPGLTALGTHRVIPIATCPIAHPLINIALAAIRELPNPRPQAMMRCGAHTGEVLIQPTPTGVLAERLAATGLALRTDGLREQLGGLTFTMRPSSFFQTNTTQAEEMARLVLANVPAGPDATVVDAYCGVGTFAALLAQRAGHVLAIEESASAVRDARENLRQLGMEQVQVIQGKTENVLPDLEIAIDAIVLDPPRMGCFRAVLDAIATRRIPRIVYVSCDPATMARDLAILCGELAAYQVHSIQPLDMFPQTHHIECVTVLDVVG